MNARPSQTGIEPRATAATGDRPLLVAMLVYGALSLAHFVHNAVYLKAYPNLPAWFTPGGVAASWLVIGAFGVIGWLLYRRVSHGAGLAAITVYALLGFGGFDHYVVAPASAHTLAMNASIVAEAAGAGVLLILVALRAAALLRTRGSLPNGQGGR